MDERMVDMDTFNGLGGRVNTLERECFGCKVKVETRQDNQDLRLNSQHADIEKIFTSIDGLKSTVNKAMGGIAVVVVLMQVAAIIIERMAK